MRIIFTLILKFMTAFANFFLIPINTAISSAFPEFTQIVNGFNTFLNTYIGPGLRYFFFMLPPFTRTIVLYYLTIVLICYTLSLSIHFIVKVVEIIKAIKIW